MTWWEACILGVVEGVTEYLPVSSTGHLLLTERALGMEKSAAADAFAVCIQGGAILAVLGLYWRRSLGMAHGWLGKIGLCPKDPAGFHLSLMILLAFVPAVVLGSLFDDWIEARLFGLWPTTAAWFVGGVAILAVTWWRKKHGVVTQGKALEDLTWKAALVIGLMQCVAMWPGTSRSLMTIVGGVVVGLSLPAAVEFSFLLGVVTLLAATAKKALDSGPEMLATFGWQPMLIGGLAAWISAVLAVKWLVGYLQRRSMGLFGYYRIGLALIVAGLLLAGVMKP